LKHEIAMWAVWLNWKGSFLKNIHAKFGFNFCGLCFPVLFCWKNIDSSWYWNSLSFILFSKCTTKTDFSFQIYFLFCDFRTVACLDLCLLTKLGDIDLLIRVVFLYAFLLFQNFSYELIKSLDVTFQSSYSLVFHLYFFLAVHQF